MMMLRNACCATLALASAALGMPLDRRDEVPHDSLNPIATRVQDGIKGQIITKYNPVLHIASGCQPYTAVDDEGNTSGGLATSGSSTGGCGDDTKGQTYARIGELNGTTAIMYAWYFPKDQPSDDISPGAHRHDWESVIIWVGGGGASNETTSVLGGGASGHGEFKITTSALPGGDTPQVEYFNSFPTNHELQFTDTVGVSHAISDWDAMPAAAQTALNNTDFGSADVPFKDENFIKNLEKAALPTNFQSTWSSS